LQKLIDNTTPGLSWRAIRKALTRTFTEDESEEILEIKYSIQDEVLMIVPRHPASHPKIQTKEISKNTFKGNYLRPIDEDS